MGATGRNLSVGAISLAVALLAGCSFGSSASDDYRSEANAICRSARGEEALERMNALNPPAELAAEHRAFVVAVRKARRLSSRLRTESAELQRLDRLRRSSDAERQARRLAALEEEVLATVARIDASIKALGLEDCAARSRPS